MIKAVFFDVDGTIYSPYTKRFIPSTIQAVHQLQAKGIHCFVCTGRMKPEVVPAIHDIGFDGIIYANGALVEYKGETIYQRNLTQEELSPIVKYINETETHIVYVRDGICSFAFEPNAMECEWWNGIGTTWQVVPLSDDIELQRIGVFAYPKGIDSYLTDSMYVSKLYDDYYEIQPKDVSKAHGVQHVLEYFGYSVDDVACFGDSLNDLEMFKLISNNYCMGNGMDEVKAIATNIIGHIDEDAIYLTCQKNGWLD